MKFEFKSIEDFFLNTLLRISIGGVLLILLSDALIYPEDVLSIIIDASILSSCLIAHFIRRHYPTVAVLIFTCVVLTAMIYQCLAVPVNTTTSLSIILIIGFIHSIMLKGKLMWLMHGITFGLIHTIFIVQFLNPELQLSKDMNDVVTVSITYSILYFILTYASAVLKLRYDTVHQELKDVNRDLHEKADEIAAQNEELRQTQDNLSELNLNLEKIVNDRTDRIQAQNEMLIKYSYTNAHHLRGPVARLLGLASVYKLDSNMDREFLIAKMVDQAHEIDTVIRSISVELEDNIVYKPLTF